MAVVVRRPEPAVDLRRGEDEPAAAASETILSIVTSVAMGANATVEPDGGKGTPAMVAAGARGSRSASTSTSTTRAASFGLEAVEKLGLDPARVFKTLVADVDGALTVAVVPVEAQLDLRGSGSARGWPSRRPPSARRAT